MSGVPDEADMQRAGTLPTDPKAGTKPVAQNVPRVMTAHELLQGSAERALSPQPREHCTTGHYKLDRITGGFRPGFVWVFGADTSWGKSSFLLSVIDENMRLGKKCLIVSSEDTEEVYGDRLMVRRSRVNAIRFRDQRLSQQEKDKVNDVAKAGEHFPLYIDAAQWPIEDLVIHLDKVIKEEDISLVFFDYLQEFKTKRRFQDERVKYKEIASLMRRVIKKNKRSGIIFSQITVTSETKIPNKHNVKESRDVANAAEVILMGFEPEIKIERPNDTDILPGTKCLLVDKVKNGPRGGKLPLDWDTESACFNTVRDPEFERTAAIVGNQFDDFGDNARYPDP